MRACVSIVAILFLFAGMVCAQAQKQIATLSSGTATITDFKGEVHIQPAGGASTSPQKGYVLGAESVIETAKGSVVLTLEDGSQVLVRAHSRVTLKNPDAGGSFLEQWLGKILVKAQKRLQGTPSFRMGTPSAVISVRGTQFEVAVDKRHKTSVSVFEGQVEVRGVRGGAGVLLAPGFATSVIENESPEPPHELPMGAAHGGGTTTRYQRDDDWPGGRPRTGDGTSQPPVIPEDTPDE
ncbi:MAG TPA: FecR family protein [Terriglobales bacterium]